MDVHAVNVASEKTLRDLGLTARGDVIAIKAFCFKELHVKEPDVDRQRKLISTVNNTGRLQPDKKGKIRQKTVHIGWLHYDNKKGKHTSIRSNKGGAIFKTRNTE